ncbi:hypothetical protein C942_04175 [Photobacterium marinum]|uniref:Uncharacterized protein n=1 Tax=Photobacterium marinum TaxID=1056511 RepID=L8JGB6_9GAMM|nr:MULTISPECIES: hypothetical protein [Photobacterium]ELR66477.1 hypothetical protein C942_04175 [Photobacterium marinum]
MPVCSNQDCNVEVSWTISQRGLELPDRIERFKVFEVKTALQQILAEALNGKKMPDISNNPTIKTLCPDCWTAQARAWGDVRTYAEARAKTDKTGVYMQVESPAFFSFEKPDPASILSCLIHEMMHLWSHDSCGLQDYNRTLNVDWDEAAADLFGYLVFKEYYKSQGKKYITPYNEYAKCIGSAEESAKMQFARKFFWNKLIAQSELYSDKMPLSGDFPEKLIAKLAELRAATPALPESMIKDKLAEYLAHTMVYQTMANCFFFGPQAIPESWGQDFNSFVSPKGIKQLLNLSKTFPPYDGNNKAHDIS